MHEQEQHAPSQMRLLRNMASTPAEHEAVRQVAATAVQSAMRKRIARKVATAADETTAASASSNLDPEAAHVVVEDDFEVQFEPRSSGGGGCNPLFEEPLGSPTSR